MDREQVKDLLAKYDLGRCSPEEQAMIKNWYQQESEKQEYEEEDPDYEYRKYRTIKKLLSGKESSKNWKLRIFAAAAAVVIIIGIGTAIFVKEPGAPGYANDIAPGANKAELTLADGRRITLDGAQNGLLANQNGVEIIKTADGLLKYMFTQEPSRIIGSGLMINTMITPRGGQYQINLPDGTKVWLNAASKLIYPASFNGREERRVEVSGEAYFEVTKNKHQPFIVVTKGLEIKVLGTHFNVSSYADDVNTTTTLLEGSVRVNTSLSMKDNTQGSIVLKPGEQSVHHAGQIKVRLVDTDYVIAWKNGEFAFRNEPLESIMQKVARWYDVEIVYDNDQVGKKLFGGTVSRYENISEILSVFERTGNVKFAIDGRRVTISS